MWQVEGGGRVKSRVREEGHLMLAKAGRGEETKEASEGLKAKVGTMMFYLCVYTVAAHSGRLETRSLLGVAFQIERGEEQWTIGRILKTYQIIRSLPEPFDSNLMDLRHFNLYFPSFNT
jgi:hypothetical protein